MASRAPTPTPSILSPPSSAPSSARPSFEAGSLPSPTTTTTMGGAGRKPRPNRSALRQFYGLAAAAAEAAAAVAPLDRAGADFDAGAHAAALCATAPLRELLRGENELVGEIRGLDGERKALVYDNYSKLIAATETIRRMRGAMEPLAPTTSTLEPAIRHIEEVSARLVGRQGVGAADGAAERSAADRDTVRWALAAPERIRRLVAAGRAEEAQRVWLKLDALCGKWADVKGTSELRERGREALHSHIEEDIA